MKKIKGIKGNILLSLGLILVSTVLLLKDIVNAKEWIKDGLKINHL